MLTVEPIPSSPWPWLARGSNLNPALIPPPESDSDDESWQPPREMKLALIGGVHPPGNKKYWILVARAGGTTLTPREARLHPFNLAGMDAAFAAAHQLHADYDDQWTVFVSRVLVEGDWDDPDDVQPVWIVEGLKEPRPVTYYFE